jgi:serpin B
MLPEAKTMQLTVPQQALVTTNNDFSFSLFRTASQKGKTGKSRILSPLSVTYLLGMINDAATGETQQEITNTLGVSGSTAQEINALCQSLMTQAPELDQQVTLRTANAIYVNKNFTLKRQYAEDMATYYAANAQSLDFSTDNAVKEINNWASKKTQGMIPQIVDELKPEAVSYLLNAVYFQAKWTRQFDAQETRRESFTTSTGSTVKVEMMHNKAEAMYAYNDIYTTLWLPYGSGSVWNMMVLLPREGKTVNDVVASLSATSWMDNINQARITELDIRIPKFTTDDLTPLNDILQAMGIQLAFDRNQAQIPNMCEDMNLYISQMMQKARIEVNEEGTKAAAVTMAETGVNSLPPVIQKGEFHADRPFVYLITENNSNAIFFIGSYMGD